LVPSFLVLGKDGELKGLLTRWLIQGKISLAISNYTAIIFALSNSAQIFAAFGSQIPADLAKICANQH